MLFDLRSGLFLTNRRGRREQRKKDVRTLFRTAIISPVLANFLLDAGWASEFEVFPEAAALPQEEEITGELWIRGIVIFLQLRFARACSAVTPDRASSAHPT